MCAILVAGSASAKLCGVESADVEVVKIEQECQTETSNAFVCMLDIMEKVQRVQEAAPRVGTNYRNRGECSHLPVRCVSS